MKSIGTKAVSKDLSFIKIIKNHLIKIGNAPTIQV